MRKIFVWAVPVLLLFCATAKAESFRTCDRFPLEGGELLYLAKSQSGGACWKRLQSRKIDFGSLALRGGRAQFSYVFSKGRYDPMFNVQVKTLIRKDDDASSNEVTLYRPAMRNRCPTFFRDHTDYSAKSLTIPGWTYQNYHSGRSIEAGRLSEFHVIFRNSVGKCLYTDDRDARLRGDFVIEGGPKYARPATAFERIAGRFPPIFGTAYADTPAIRSKYSEVRMEIRKGFQKSGLVSANFFLNAGDSYEVVLRDLATMEGGQRRKKISFTVTE
jgi:hypothetical protein